MTPLERLLQEAIPTRPDPAPPQPHTYQQYWTPQEQDTHWRQLAEALGTTNIPRPTPPGHRAAA
ncbi:hypothetical protein [Streptomyces aurantiogriseus]|uniref:Uncharacterized protein n=1 Tax=Streptomyces aurantiogriseus TaxID=66870 RepID=A0A918FNV2_9ACTN|nr:hypothetical protein [Streptomyces aurantiogriseus]GGR61187.1 hypothetical protein GCM10010251_92390 [Streptomyces aurantiogriseus]